MPSEKVLPSAAAAMVEKPRVTHSVWSMISPKAIITALSRMPKPRNGRAAARQTWRSCSDVGLLTSAFACSAQTASIRRHSAALREREAAKFAANLGSSSTRRDTSKTTATPLAEPPASVPASARQGEAGSSAVGDAPAGAALDGKAPPPSVTGQAVALAVDPPHWAPPRRYGRRRAHSAPAGYLALQGRRGRQATSMLRPAARNIAVMPRRGATLVERGAVNQLRTNT
mmetsp:Transcript_59583/g.127978  ORF Transcript_59583/g.127978 Transcript_59583/m.127978 type:complete len:229 (+) Transcript_59583:694-1380(+)